MNPITSFLVFVFTLAGLPIGNRVSPYLALALASKEVPSKAPLQVAA